MCASITFRPDPYQGSFSINEYPSRRVAGPFNGPGPVSAELSAGRYVVEISHGAGFVFTVSEQGQVDCGDTPGLSCNDSTVAFMTAEVHIVPGRYKGQFRIEGAEQDLSAKQRRVTLVAGLEHSDAHAGYIFHLAPSNGFRFNVDPQGGVWLNEHHAAAADGGKSQLKLNTTDITITPQNYEGTWSVRNVAPEAQDGPRRVVVVPGVVGYILDLRPGINGRFDVGADGTPHPSELVIPDGAQSWRFALAK